MHDMRFSATEAGACIVHYTFKEGNVNMLAKITMTTAAALVLTAGLAAAQGNPGAHMMEQWDTDSDGVLTLEEARAKRNEIFYMFDKDSDGTLSAEDWAGVEEHLAAELGAGEGHGEGGGGGQGNGPGAAIHDAMTPAFNDADGDGTVTAAEFEAATDALFKRLDRTGDGVVTVADFGRP